MATQAAQTSLNFDDIIHYIQQFLEIGVHYILYVRDVYPADLFDQYKKWGVPVWKARHPKLASYVAEVVKNSMEHIREGKVKKFVVAIKDDSTNEALEHFVFGLTWLKPIEWFQTGDAKRKYESGMSQAELEVKLRSFLLKLSTLDAQLLPLPKDLHFAVFLELNQPVQPLIGENPLSGEPAPWLPATMSEADPIDRVDPNDRMHIVRKSTFGMIDMELEVEENAAKLDLISSGKAAGAAESEDDASPRLSKADKGKGRA